MTAVDLDTGNNARLTYRIVGGDQMFQHQSSAVGRGQHGSRNATTSMSKTPIALHTSTPFTDDVSELFGIFPNSGWIYLRGILDREAREQYDITVLASDNGTPSATATTHVIVNVLDANDNDPTFSRDSYEFSVEENVKRGAVIGQLSATDADLGVNSAVRFSLIPSNTSFQVNPNTGKSNSEYFIFIYFCLFFLPFALWRVNRVEIDVVKKSSCGFSHSVIELLFRGMGLSAILVAREMVLIRPKPNMDAASCSHGVQLDRRFS